MFVLFKKKQLLFLSVHVDDYKMVGKKQIFFFNVEEFDEERCS